MPAAPRVDWRDYFTPEEWAGLNARSSWRGLAMVAHAWTVILAAVGLGVWIPWTLPLGVMIIGTRQLGLAILMHEAAHGALHPNEAVNDWVGQWLCAAPVGAKLNAYRPYHLSHHRYAQQAEDPDLILSAPFPVSRASLVRKMIRDLTAQTFIKQRFGPLFSRRGTAEAVVSGQTAKDAGPFLIVNALLLATTVALGFWHAGFWWAYPVLWLLPMATWFPLVTRLRNIAEHACTPDANDPLRHARTTRANWLERAFIAPYHVHHHAEHHMFMWLPCWRLPTAHRLLTRKGVTGRMEVQPGYLTVLRTASGG
jgi:fatty acid desaturase